MELQVEHTDREALIRVVGSVDVDTAYDMYLAVIGAAEDGYSPVVLELSQVDFLDSVGLGMLIRCRDDLPNNYESKLILRAPSKRIRDLLKITALTAEFDVHDS